MSELSKTSQPKNISHDIGYEDLVEKAKKLRRDTFNAFVEHGEAHLGGSFSIIEMLIALYEKVLGDNDKFILSKAHASFPLCLLLQEKGLNPKLTTHLEIDPMNGIHCTTGSLGHGLPNATGMAMGRKLQKKSGKIYVMMSDGECQEGTSWESMLTAPHRKLNNLVAIVDNNNIQGSGYVNEILPIDCLYDTAKSCGWEVAVINGHDNHQIVDALKQPSKKPYMIIAKTIKGKGVSYMENDPSWHARWPDSEHEKMAIEELSS